MPTRIYESPTAQPGKVQIGVRGDGCCRHTGGWPTVHERGVGQIGHAAAAGELGGEPYTATPRGNWQVSNHKQICSGATAARPLASIAPHVEPTLPRLSQCNGPTRATLRHPHNTQGPTPAPTQRVIVKTRGDSWQLKRAHLCCRPKRGRRCVLFPTAQPLLSHLNPLGICSTASSQPTVV
jgi:hypothetical protein